MALDGGRSPQIIPGAAPVHRAAGVLIGTLAVQCLPEMVAIVESETTTAQECDLRRPVELPDDEIEASIGTTGGGAGRGRGLRLDVVVGGIEVHQLGETWTMIFHSLIVLLRMFPMFRS
jgi:hypothetical protein